MYRKLSHLVTLIASWKDCGRTSHGIPSLTDASLAFVVPNFQIPADACSREHLNWQGEPIPVPHKSPMDLLMEHLTMAATNEGNLEEKYTNLARLMVRYGARIDHQRWDVYVGPEKKAYIMSKLFPTVNTT